MSNKPFKFLTQSEWDNSDIRQKILDIEKKLIDSISKKEEKGEDCAMLWKQFGFVNGMKTALIFDNEFIENFLQNIENYAKN